MVGTFGLASSVLSQNHIWTGQPTQPIQPIVPTTSWKYPPNMASYLNYSSQSDPRMTFGAMLDLDQCNVTGSYNVTGSEAPPNSFFDRIGPTPRFLDYYGNPLPTSKPIKDDNESVTTRTFTSSEEEPPRTIESGIKVDIKSDCQFDIVHQDEEGISSDKEAASPMSMASSASSSGKGDLDGNESSKSGMDGNDSTKGGLDGNDSETSSEKPKRYRTKFTPQQTCELDKVFTKCRYPNLVFREQIAKSLGLSESRIQVWFQNRRAKLKREGKINLKAYIVSRSREAPQMKNPSPTLLNQTQWPANSTNTAPLSFRNNIYNAFAPPYPVDLGPRYNNVLYQPNIARPQLIATGSTPSAPYEDLRFRPATTTVDVATAAGRIPCPNVTLPFL